MASDFLCYVTFEGQHGVAVQLAGPIPPVQCDVTEVGGDARQVLQHGNDVREERRESAAKVYQ